MTIEALAKVSSAADDREKSPNDDRRYSHYSTRRQSSLGTSTEAMGAADGLQYPARGLPDIGLCVRRDGLADLRDRICNGVPACPG